MSLGKTIAGAYSRTTQWSFWRPVFYRFILAPLYGGFVLGPVCGGLVGSIVAFCHLIQEFHFGVDSPVKELSAIVFLSMMYGVAFGAPLGMKLGFLFSIARHFSSVHRMFVYVMASTLAFGIPFALLFPGNILGNLYIGIAGAIAGFVFSCFRFGSQPVLVNKA